MTLPAVRVPRAALLALLLLAAQCRENGHGPPSPEGAPPAPRSTYVGGQRCTVCHERQAEHWRGSHHDLAMQEATEETVLGDFDDASFTHFGVESTFSKRDGKFVVRTEGADGEVRDFLVSYVFGVTPLQQYLVAFPDGRYQTLPLCWDARPEAEGGQRWFHIYPDERIAPDDALYWTGPAQN
ncbi:MAG: hypothetical protein ACYS99_05120, partial [Planctomycetota bacterium]